MCVCVSCHEPKKTIIVKIILQTAKSQKNKHRRHNKIISPVSQLAVDTFSDQISAFSLIKEKQKMKKIIEFFFLHNIFLQSAETKK